MKETIIYCSVSVGDLVYMYTGSVSIFADWLVWLMKKYQGSNYLAIRETRTWEA